MRPVYCLTGPSHILIEREKKLTYGQFPTVLSFTPILRPDFFRASTVI